jgi:ABC-type phosphate transport system substrate-binding protein
MSSFSMRRLASACVVPAAMAAALVAPGSASAALGEQCSGANIGAQGSSLQKIAQDSVWNPDFNISTAKAACNGKQGDKNKPTVTYTSTGSGAGLKSWGAEPKELKEVTFAASNAFVGTDEPPNEKQIGEIEANESIPTAETLLTLPVVQESVAVIVNLPAGCTATSTSNPGRLVLNEKTLEGIFAGTVKTWGALTDGGDKLTGEGCGTTAIQPVVRFDQSGTTHIFKRFLNVIDSSGLEVETEPGKTITATWGELSEGALNTQWPVAAKVIKPAAKGGGEEIAKVLATPGSIGYVNLAEARANASYASGTGTATFWAPIQNSEKVSGKTVKYTYADPSSNKEVTTVASANCKSTVYTNGKHGFPPPAVTAPWNEVTTEATSKTYPLCGLTYDLAFTEYSLLPSTSLTEATSVNNYLRFVTEAKGGQTAILNHDYLALPKGEVLTDAEKGAQKIAD